LEEELKEKGKEVKERKEANGKLSSSYGWVKELISEIGTNLLTGIHSKGKNGNFHNSVMLLDKNARLIEIYNKIHPIPFGEFVPARRFLDNIGPLRIIKYDIRAGNEYTIFPISKGKIGSTICFESALPQIPRKLRSNGAQILFVVTNDGWFKNSLELEEHFYMARIRAVENGVYYVQCANTGISGICAPNGEIINATSKNKACTLSESVHFMPDQTFYCRYGDIFSYICILIFLVWLIFKLLI
jgi:apolipoprotein N-acyltransferase